ncbi:MAG: Rieske 2Fe-2S domain-containing protein [Acidobacteria bacterium]|nr:Rieske 2Fe-2S domain-containing protein [Acidobacteriota bacterium]
MTDSDAKNQTTPAGSPPPAAPAAKAPAQVAAKGTKASSNGNPLNTRRRIVWSLFWGWIGIWCLATVRFFFPRTLFEPRTRFSVGYPTDFGIGVDTRFQQDFRIWVVRNAERLFVIYARCTHLGCTPDWKESENKFKCPCHGSGYDSEGVNFEGPAPRPMDRAKVELDATGRIIVDTSVLYEKPKEGRDEFDDSGAFLTV